MLDSAGMTTYEHLAKDQKKKGRFMLSITLVLLLVLLWPFSLHAQAPFYQGKTIRPVAGTPAGSVYDLYARMVAQFIPKHIPGAPNVIVQNMPGVASMVAANYIYEVAKPDGLTIGSIQPALYFDQLVGRKEVSSTGKGLPGSATPPYCIICFTCAAIRHTKPSRTSAKLRCRPSAALKVRRHQPITCPSYWRKPLGPNSMS
jgi:hypothetical protein